MNRDEVLAVVRERVLAVLSDLSPDQFDENMSLTDLGADSLDMVEIVSASMRALKIRIPRTKLSELKNVAGLVDLLLVTMNEPTS